MTRSNPWISKADWTPLPKGEIDVWKFSLALRENDRNILSQDELERFDRTDSKPKHERKIAGRAQLRRILSLYTSTDPSEISFEYGQNQKPLLPKHSDLSFNLSHSENMGLVAVTYSRRVGIDLEYLEAERPFSKIAERFLTKSENDFINGYPEEERSRAFYRIWTLNEAYLKALGTGLSVSSNDFSIVPDNDRGRFLQDTKVADDLTQKWMFETIKADNSYLGALCFEDLDTATRFWKV
jgi:4'-phosphopantetheinyl transferase|tara:strand:+ start:131 stop:850 length:720 start_codon:yes stop_codon:yes gene_type:complete